MAAGATYDAIKTYTFASNGTSFSWTDIPSTYTDLVIIAYTKNNTNNNYEAYITYNGDSSANYSQGFTLNYNGSLQAGQNININQIRPIKTGSTYWSSAQVNIMDYSATNKYKTSIGRSGDGGFASMLINGLWRSTSAINRIDITIESGAQFVAGTKFDLYGIASA
jgi:hypothetical protein